MASTLFIHPSHTDEADNLAQAGQPHGRLVRYAMTDIRGTLPAIRATENLATRQRNSHLIGWRVMRFRHLARQLLQPRRRIRTASSTPGSQLPFNRINQTANKVRIRNPEQPWSKEHSDKECINQQAITQAHCYVSDKRKGALLAPFLVRCIQLIALCLFGRTVGASILSLNSCFTGPGACITVTLPNYRFGTNRSSRRTSKRASDGHVAFIKVIRNDRRAAIFTCFTELV